MDDVEWKKPYIKEYILHGSVYIKVLKQAKIFYWGKLKAVVDCGEGQGLTRKGGVLILIKVWVTNVYTFL